MEKFPRHPEDDDPEKDRHNARRIDPELAPGEVFGVAADDTPPTEPKAAEPVRKRKRKRKPLLDGAGREIPKDRILDREELEPQAPWWTLPAIFGTIGGLVILAVIVAISMKAKDAGATVGAMLLVVAVVIVALQSMLVTTLLWFIGGFFGIDYGPILQGIVRIVSVVVLTDGLTMAFSQCSPCGAMVAAMFAFGAFQVLFKLSLQETLLSVGGIIGASWILNAVIVVILISKAAAKA